MLPNESQKQLNVRSNLTFNPASNLTVEYNTTYTRNDMQLAPHSNNSQGLLYQPWYHRGSPLGEFWRDRIHLVEVWDITMDNSHLITGVTVRHTPTSWLDTRVTVGIDRVDSEIRNIRPFGFVMQPKGVINNTRFTDLHYHVGLGEQCLVGPHPTRLRTRDHAFRRRAVRAGRDGNRAGILGQSSGPRDSNGKQRSAETEWGRPPNGEYGWWIRAGVVWVS